MRYDTAKLALAIRKAVTAARAFETVEDGGTCNFDSAYLRVPGMRDKQAQEIERLSGVGLSLHTYRWHGRILQIIGGRSGQAHRQTAMAEAMYKSLKSDGLASGMYYQMD